MASSFPSGDFTENVSAIALVQNNHAKAIAVEVLKMQLFIPKLYWHRVFVWSNIFSARGADTEVLYKNFVWAKIFVELFFCGDIF